MTTRTLQPLWLSTIMRYYIQPVVKRLGIKKRVTWHTFRRTYTTLLHANGEDVKVVQELLRHSSSRITMGIVDALFLANAFLLLASQTGI